MYPWAANYVMGVVDGATNHQSYLDPLSSNGDVPMFRRRSAIDGYSGDWGLDYTDTMGSFDANYVQFPYSNLLGATLMGGVPQYSGDQPYNSPGELYNFSPLLDWDVACNPQYAPLNRPTPSGFDPTPGVVEPACNPQVNYGYSYWNFVCDLEQNPQGWKKSTHNYSANVEGQCFTWSRASGLPNEAYDAYGAESGTLWGNVVWARSGDGRMGRAP